MKNTIYLVTGAAGLLGSHIVSQLLKQGHTVRGFILPEEKELLKEPIPHLTYISGDVRSPESLEALFPPQAPPDDKSVGETDGGTDSRNDCESGCRNDCESGCRTDCESGYRTDCESGYRTDCESGSGMGGETDSETDDLILIHCAGLISIYGGKSPTVHAVNVNGTKNIVSACLRHHVKRLVYVSSVHAIPEMPNHTVIKEINDFSPEKVVGYYAKTKAEATQHVLNSVKKGLDAVILQPTGIIGPTKHPMGSLMHMIANYVRKGMPIAVRGGYDFVDVRDVAAGVIKAAQKGKAGECYILSNRFISLRELFSELSKAAGQKKPRFFLPAWIAKCAAPFAQLHYKCWKKTPVFTPYAMYTLTSNGNFSHEKASRELGYRPRPLRQTVKDMILQLKKGTAVR